MQQTQKTDMYLQAMDLSLREFCNAYNHCYELLNVLNKKEKSMTEEEKKEYSRLSKTFQKKVKYFINRGKDFQYRKGK